MAPVMSVDRLFQLGYRLAYPAALLLRRLTPRMVGTGIAVWHGGEILLVWHSYRHGWSLPGGWIRPGESAEACASRELAEEVGVVASPDDLTPVPPVMRGQILFEYRPAERPAITVDNREILRGRFLDPGAAVDLGRDARLYLSR